MRDIEPIAGILRIRNGGQSVDSGQNGPEVAHSAIAAIRFSDNCVIAVTDTGAMMS
jgi:hypothetical protein